MLPAGTCVPSEKTKGVMTFLFMATAQQTVERYQQVYRESLYGSSYLFEEDGVELSLSRSCLVAEYPDYAFSIVHPQLCATIPLVTVVDIQDVGTIHTVRKLQAKQMSCMSDDSSKWIGVSAYRGYLMSASEQETHGSFQNSGNAHYARSA